MAGAALLGYCVIWRAMTLVVWAAVLVPTLAVDAAEKYVWAQVEKAFS